MKTIRARYQQAREAFVSRADAKHVERSAELSFDAWKSITKFCRKRRWTVLDLFRRRNLRLLLRAWADVTREAYVEDLVTRLSRAAEEGDTTVVASLKTKVSEALRRAEIAEAEARDLKGNY